MQITHSLEASVGTLNPTNLEPFGLLFPEKVMPVYGSSRSSFLPITTHEPEETGNDGTYKTDWEDDEDEDDDEDEEE